MRKLCISLLCLLMSFGVMTAQAGKMSTKSKTSELVGHHFTLGVSYSNFPVSAFWVSAGLLDQYWLVRVSGAFVRFNRNKDTSGFGLFCGDLHLGGRHPLTHDIGFEYGVAGGIVTRDHSVPNSTTGYSVGPFIGIDYIASQHVIISGTIQPYSYVRDGDNRSASNAIFERGMLRIAYIF